MKKILIDTWKDTTNEIVKQFLFDYFDVVNPKFDWVADEVGTVFCYSDFFFGFDTVITCFELAVTEKQLFDWYDFSVRGGQINLKTFIFAPEIREQQEKKYIEELRQRVEQSRKELEEAIENFKSYNKTKENHFL